MGTRRRLRLGFTLGLGVTLIGSLMTGTPAQAGPATPLAVPGAPEWHEGASTSAAARSGRPADVRVRGGRRLLLDVDAMVRTLARTPRSHGNRNRASVIGLPTPEGRVARFAVTESPVVEPALGARRPETRSYAGTGLDDPTASVRLDRCPSWFRAQVRSARGGWLIDPEARGDTRRHVAYRRADLVNNHGPRRELGPRPARRSQATDRAGSTIGPEARTAAARSIGSQLRTYRLALATTGEYSQYHGGTVPLVHNALVSAVNRLNGIFETELGVRLVLVANNDSLINLNPATDPYSNADAGALLTQNQNRIDTVIGNANYDVGHVFSTGGGGLAGLGVIGISGEKAQGETGSNAPTGDAFWVDYVAHEVGHQFGGDHTFSGTGGNCGGNGNPTT
ncbi:MAG: reprolysin-like metallopeptidase, partial [Actinomycetota bacterium]